MNIQTSKNQKKQKGQNLGKTKKLKKQNGRTYVPVSGMGSVLLFFFVFLVFRGKTKKTKMAEPMSQCLAWGQSFFFWFFEVKPKNEKKKKQNGRTYVPVSGMGSVLLFFFFGFFEVKPKKTKKTKWQNLCPSVWHGVSTFVFFLVFRGFWNILVSDMGSAILFCLCFLFLSRFLQFSGVWHGFCHFALVFQGFCNIRPFLKRL